MELKGRLMNIAKDIRNNEFVITLAAYHVPSGIDSLIDGGDLSVSLKKWREKRSLTANAYYWVLIQKISEAINAPQSVVHNQMLRDYGVLEILEGKPLTIMVPETDEARAKVDRADLYHLKPTGHLVDGRDGMQFRAWYVLKGSSEYDTKEMATLIDGAVQEAKEMRIETLPEEEVRRMLEAYEVNYSKRIG